MAIFTRMGSRVEVLGATETGDTVWVLCRRASGPDREFDLCDLVADEGVTEIEQAIAKARGEGER